MLITGIHAATSATGGITGTTGTTGTANNGTSTTGTTGTTGTAGTTGSSSSSGVNGAATLGGTDFLTLMLAQLQNQDPTNPVDSNTFLSQLAELSTVQGITNLNTSFTTLSNSLTSSQALQASSLLGHEALVPSSTATTAAAGASVTGAVTVPQSTSQVTLSISNSAGVLVQTINLGAQSAGTTNFSWNGTEGNGSQAPAGTYTLAATYAGATSGSTAATTLVNGAIESVSMGSGSTGMSVNVAGVGSVLFSNVQQISN